MAEEAGAEAGDKRRGRVYRLEPAGREALSQELTRMERVLGDAKAAVAGGSGS